MTSEAPLDSFKKDDEWQRQVRDRILVPHFYESYSEDGHFVLFDKGYTLAVRMQREFHVDAVIERDGRALFIDDKIVRWPKDNIPHKAYCFETCSCTKPTREKLGWGLTSATDFLLYCFEMQDHMTFDCRLLNFRRLKRVAVAYADTLPTFGPQKTINATQGKLVPFDLAAAHGVCVWSRHLHEEHGDVSVPISEDSQRGAA